MAGWSPLAGLFLFFPSRAVEASSFFPSSPFADHAAGATAAAFLNQPAGARAQALGGSYSAAANNSEAVFWNPAGLASLEPMRARRPLQRAMQAMAEISARAEKTSEKIGNNLAAIDWQNAFTGKLRDALGRTRAALGEVSAQAQSASDLIPKKSTAPGPRSRDSIEAPQDATARLRSILDGIGRKLTERAAALIQAADEDRRRQGGDVLNARGALLANFAAEAQADLETLRNVVRDESERLRNSKRREEHGSGNASDVSSGVDALLSGSYAGSAAYAHSAGDAGVFGAGLAYFSAGTIQGYGVMGDPTSAFAPNDLALGFYYAKRVRFFRSIPGLKLGAGLKLIHSSIAAASGTGAAADLGAQIDHMAELGELPVDAGFGVRNIGPPLRIGNASDPLPFAAQGGFLWHLSPIVNGMLDGHLPSNNSPYLSLGLEANFSIGEDLTAGARAGYNMNNAGGVDGSLTGMTAGFGVDLRNFRLDYAWVPFGNLGFTNRITLGFAF